MFLEMLNKYRKTGKPALPGLLTISEHSATLYYQIVDASEVSEEVTAIASILAGSVVSDELAAIAATVSKKLKLELPPDPGAPPPPPPPPLQAVKAKAAAVNNAQIVNFI